MSRLLSLVLASVLTGCCATTEIGRPAVSVRSDDGETLIADVMVRNVSYSLFGVLPIESGSTWKTGAFADRDWWNAVWFEDRCTLDENLASLRAALKEVGSNRTMNLVTESDSWRLWSLFIVKRKVMKSTCSVLKRKFERNSQNEYR